MRHGKQLQYENQYESSVVGSVGDYAIHQSPIMVIHHRLSSVLLACLSHMLSRYFLGMPL